MHEIMAGMDAGIIYRTITMDAPTPACYIETGSRHNFMHLVQLHCCHGPTIGQRTAMPWADKSGSPAVVPKSFNRP